MAGQDRVIVGFHNSTDAELVDERGGEVTREYRFINAAAAVLPRSGWRS